ncbi:MAG: DUF1552 domain-containing protein [Myxococcota bacterium]
MTTRRTFPSLGRSRRDALRTLLSAAIGLPWLETFAPSSAAAQPLVNKRFVVMFSANGTIRNSWLPAGSETTFSLSPILAPLAQHQSDLVVIAGVDQQGAGGDGHQNGMGGMLTGAPLLAGRFAGVGAPPAGWADGPSVDQRVASVISQGSPFQSLELAVQAGAADNWGRMIYRGRNRPLPPREDPVKVFDDVFAAATLDPAERERRRARRQSILDKVTHQLGELSQRVAAADKQRLDAHLTNLRTLEARLDSQASALAACDLPVRPSAGLGGNDAFPSIGAAMIDLLVVALACGQTKVASLQWSRSVSNVRFTWLGIDDEHHGLSHAADNDTTAQQKLTLINRWYAERYAELITKLKSYPEGTGTLFDNCLLLWCNELGTGNTHSRENAPYVLAGSAGGALTTGRFLNFEGTMPHNNLLLSILRLMGLADTSFGKREWCTGLLPGLI